MRPRAGAVALLVAIATTLVACGSGAGDDGDDAVSSTTTTTAAASTTVATTTTVPGRVIEVTIVDGRPEGGARREEVALGETVRLVVISDTADEVHVHTYDIRGDVAAGGTVELEFVADIPGVIEVELERRHTRILTLEVRP